jgi:hypothetical protein
MRRSMSLFPPPRAADDVLGSARLSRRQALALITAAGAVGWLDRPPGRG